LASVRGVINGVSQSAAAFWLRNLKNLRRAAYSYHAIQRKIAIRCAGGEFTVHQAGVDLIDSIKRPYEDHMMLNLRLARPVLIALTACAANIFVQGSALADDAQENKVLKEQMKQMMQRMDALQKQVEALSRQQAATPPPPVVAAPPPPPIAPPQLAPPPVVAAAPVVKY
jgi:hypothetical protein